MFSKKKLYYPVCRKGSDHCKIKNTFFSTILVHLIGNVDDAIIDCSSKAESVAENIKATLSYK